VSFIRRHGEIRRFHAAAAIRMPEQVKRAGRECRAIFTWTDQGLALVLLLCVPLSLQGPNSNRGPSI